MKYFAQHLPTEGHAYNYSSRTHNDITVGLESSDRVSSRTYRHILTKQSDDAYFQHIEDSTARNAAETGFKRGSLEQMVWEGLKKVAKKTLQRLQKNPKSVKPAKTLK